MELELAPLERYTDRALLPQPNLLLFMNETLDDIAWIALKG